MPAWSSHGLFYFPTFFFIHLPEEQKIFFQKRKDYIEIYLVLFCEMRRKLFYVTLPQLAMV